MAAEVSLRTLPLPSSRPAATAQGSLGPIRGGDLGTRRRGNGVLRGMLADVSKPEPNTHTGDVEDAGARALATRLASYRVIYIAVAVFALLYVFSVNAAQQALTYTFESRVFEAMHVSDFNESVAVQIQRRIDTNVKRSAWVRYGGARVNVLAIGRDRRTLIYGGGATPPPPDAFNLLANAREAERLLPATAQVNVALPHNTVLSNAILLVYAAALIQGLFFYNRSLSRRELAQLEAALSARDAAANRAQVIEGELDSVRNHLRSVEPTEREQAELIADLQGERERLELELGGLAAREEELRNKAARAVELDAERRSLEELLDEAASELSTRDEAIHDLESRLTKADKKSKAAGAARTREADSLAKRLRTLYKGVEFDDRAIHDIAALGDETLRLKCEENLKRLDSEAENVSVRRKVGGLPNHLAIFELSFAGKGRVYYSKGNDRRFRVRLVGGKASQRTDLDYLRRLED